MRCPTKRTTALITAFILHVNILGNLIYLLGQFPTEQGVLLLI